MNLRSHDSIKTLKKEMRFKVNADARDRIHAVIIAMKGYQIGKSQTVATKWWPETESVPVSRLDRREPAPRAPSRPRIAGHPAQSAFRFCP